MASHPSWSTRDRVDDQLTEMAVAITALTRLISEASPT
jgi:hypothetical protein